MNTKERHEYARLANEFSRKLLISGKHKRAEHLMRKAIYFAPEKAVYYNQYGVLLMYLVRFKEARDYFNKAIGLCSASARGPLERELMAHIYNNRSACFFMEKKFELALADSINGIELLPKSANLWQQKSHILLRLGSFSKALESVEIAIMLDNSSAYSYYLCALAHYFLRNFRDSLREVKAGLKLSELENNQALTAAFLEIEKQILALQQRYGDALDDKAQSVRVLH